MKFSHFHLKLIHIFIITNIIDYYIMDSYKLGKSQYVIFVLHIDKKISRLKILI